VFIAASHASATEVHTSTLWPRPASTAAKACSSDASRAACSMMLERRCFALTDREERCANAACARARWDAACCDTCHAHVHCTRAA
jgi:hypothetical protein